MAEAVVLGSEGWVTAVLVSLVLVVLVMAAGACVVIRGRRYVPPNGQSHVNGDGGSVTRARLSEGTVVSTFVRDLCLYSVQT